MDSKENAVKAIKEILFNGSKPPQQIIDKNNNKKKLVLFIHGWSGTADNKTWGNFFTLFDKDLPLREKYINDTYAYYAPKINFKWWKWSQGKKMPNINELSEGLKTTLEQEYREYDSITLFCHSLGGLVAMRYLISLQKQNLGHKIEKLIMYATPIQGSDLASIGGVASKQVKQMCTNSDFLDSLNEDWETLKIPDKVKTYYCIGDQDGVVNIKNASRHFLSTNTTFERIKGCDHNNVVKPKNNTDLSYVILRNILFETE